MHLYPFGKTAQFLKGNLHTHSNRSDGALSPDDLCLRYKEAGYDFLCISDHFVGKYSYPITKCRVHDDGGFTTLQGAELHSGALSNGEIWHILAVGLPDDFAPSNSPHFFALPDQETGPEIAKRAAEAGAFVSLVHPEWFGLSVEDAKSISSAHSIEIYNHNCGVEYNRANGQACFEQLLTMGVKLNCIATDDAHFHTNDHFGGWVMVASKSRSQKDILAALKKGAFYSSQGPEIKDISLKDNILTLETSPVMNAYVLGAGSLAVSEIGKENTLFKFDMTILGNSPWFRVSIQDQMGKSAWSNPYWL